MNELITLQHNYPVYIAVWFSITLFILWLFRFMSKKMKNTEVHQSKSSLFTITIFIGIPLLLAAVLGPLLFIIGDKNMLPIYRYVWIGLIGISIFYFIFKQKSNKNH